MKNYLKHYCWFWKESFSFMKGYNRLYIVWGCLRKAPKFAMDMVKWDNMTSKQKENWYLSKDERMFTIE